MSRYSINMDFRKLRSDSLNAIRHYVSAAEKSMAILEDARQLKMQDEQVRRENDKLAAEINEILSRLGSV